MPVADSFCLVLAMTCPALARPAVLYLCTVHTFELISPQIPKACIFLAQSAPVTAAPQRRAGQLAVGRSVGRAMHYIHPQRSRAKRATAHALTAESGSRIQTYRSS